MDEPGAHALTELLLAWGDGDEEALARIAPLVHAELYRLAKRYMSRERPDHLLHRGDPRQHGAARRRESRRGLRDHGRVPLLLRSRSRRRLRRRRRRNRRLAVRPVQPGIY